MNIKKPKLLSPAGSPESLKAAVNCGADAVYLGARQFSARGRAVNFTPAEIAEAVDYCHLRGVEAYIAVNVLLRGNELPEAAELIRSLAELGADAFILQDIGLARAVKGAWPEITLHASTQMTILSPGDARFLAGAGFSRAVLGRELTLGQIKSIASLGIIETEAFVHGALCVCYSGQCLMSAKIGGRSGNMGQCAQPCRLPYILSKGGAEIAEGHLLSPRDLVSLEILPEIINAGVDCLKIEGRMKSAVYTAAVTAEYRRALDGRAASEKAVGRLNQVFNRGGSSTGGYFHKHAGGEMISRNSPRNTGVLIGAVANYDKNRQDCIIKANEPLSPGDGIEIQTQSGPRAGAGIDKEIQAGGVFSIRVAGDIRAGGPVYRTRDKALEDETRREMVIDRRKLALKGRFRAKANERVALELSYGGVNAKITADAPEAAINAGTSADEMKRRLSKTGMSTFAIEWECFEAGEGLFFPASILNALRREALEVMSRELTGSYRKTLPPAEISLPALEQEVAHKRRVHASIAREWQLEAALSAGADRIVLEPAIFNIANKAKEMCGAYGAELFLALPLGSDAKEMAAGFPADGYYARSWGHIGDLAGVGKPVVADYPIQAFNKLSIGYVMRFCQGFTFHPETPMREACENACPGSELIVYGRLPLMVTRQCPIGNFSGKRGPEGFGCSLAGSGGYALKDRKGYSFPVEADCARCSATILNAVVAGLPRNLGDVATVGAFRLLFYQESAGETSSAVKRIAKKLGFQDYGGLKYGCDGY